jgi:hypothetical protein
MRKAWCIRVAGVNFVPVSNGRDLMLHDEMRVRSRFPTMLNPNV